MAEPLPAPVRRFISEHVESVGMLELLLLLRATPEKTWTALELSRALVTTEELIADNLRRLERDGLVTQADGVYTFRAGRSEGTLEQLAECYARRRHTVIGVIYGADTRDASTISDAFRLRPRKD